MQTIHHYHPDTYLYLGAGLADVDPLNSDVSLIPAYATTEPPPAPGHNEQVAFDAETGVWRIDPIPQPEPIPPLTPEQVWALIKAERDRRADAGGYLAAGKWFHSDQKSRTQQLGLVLLGANIPAALQWKTMDGSAAAMTPALAQQILGAAAASDNAIFTTAEMHKAAMEASAEPAAYDFSSGWPAGFGE